MGSGVDFVNKEVLILSRSGCLYLNLGRRAPTKNQKVRSLKVRGFDLGPGEK